MLIFTVLVASILVSLIPALVVKVLISLIFGRIVSYLKVLAVMAFTYVAVMIVVTLLGYDTEASLDAMPDWIAAGLSVLTFVFQALILAIAVSDENGEFVPIGKWTAVLLLQYVVYLLIGLAIIAAS